MTKFYTEKLRDWETRHGEAHNALKKHAECVKCVCGVVVADQWFELLLLAGVLCAVGCLDSSNGWTHEPRSDPPAPQGKVARHWMAIGPIDAIGLEDCEL